MGYIKKIGKSLVISFFFLIITFSSAIYGFTRLINKADWVEHTNVVLIKLQRIISVLKDAETGQRGYLLTEDPEFLEPFIGSYYKVIQNYKEVRELVIDNRTQLKRLDTLLVLIDKRYNLLNKTIALEKENNRDAALQIVLQKEGKITMDKIRLLISDLENEETLLKTQRFTQVQRSTIFTSAFLVLSSFFTLLTVAVAFYKLKNKINDEQVLKNNLELTNAELSEKNEEYLRSQEHLKQLNLTLEEKIQERTSHLSEAKEELQSLNIELKQQNSKLKRINNDLDNFIYTASHDLKVPISNLEGLITLLKKKQCYEQDDLKQIIDMMSLSGTKLKSVIEDLALIVKVQNDVDTNLDIIQIREAVEDIEISIKDLVTSSGTRIIIKCNKYPSIIFSRNYLRSILYNLITNAIKYKAPDRTPEIIIESGKEEEFTTLSISDNGLGIEASKKDKIFSMFKRLHGHVEGSGIGLFIVKRIIDNAGGKIEVESEVGKGTTFKIYFPINAEKNEET